MKQQIDELIEQTIEDPRIDRRKLHELSDIIILCLIAVICGAESWENIELFGQSKQSLLGSFLKLPNGIPSHDTIERLFRRMDSQQFEAFFRQWVKQLAIQTDGKLISIDGKTVRGSRDEANGKYAIHVVSAWCNENNLVLGQLKTAVKCNEIEAVMQLLELIDIQGAIITADAMSCQKKIVEKIISKQADYLLAVKDNQKELHEQIKQCFALQKPQDIHTTITKDHGRIETRTCEMITEFKWLDNRSQWSGLRAIIRVSRKREIKNVVTEQTAHYITSVKQNALYFNQAVRTHWGIENTLHWVLDVQFHEDADRKRKDHAAANFSIIRKLALDLVRRVPIRRLGVNNRRLLAGWDNEYLTKILANLNN
jgi:predicted transposase YbfD/YdcC